MNSLAHVAPSARHSFRLACSVGVSLAVAYGLALPAPFMAPLFATLLGAPPARPPPDPGQLLVLVATVCATLGAGILLGPLLQHAPLSALLIVAAGLLFSHRLALHQGKEVPGTLLALGFTVIPAASAFSQALASALILAIVAGIVVAVISQWLVYPLFPGIPPAPPHDDTVRPGSGTNASWLSLRATLITLPAVLVALINPSAYLPLVIKGILLGRESNTTRLRAAGRELIGATALGGACAIAVWLCLGLAVELAFFVGWMLLLSLLLAAGAYGVWRLPLAASFWINTLTTTIILVGAAAQDSANGKDVYQAFVVRMLLFITITIYAVLAMHMLEHLRAASPRASHPREIA